MIKSTFDLIKLRAEVALQQVLVEQGHQPRVYGHECPFCQSTDFVKYSLEKGKQRYRCCSCKRRFNERPVFKCDCLVVGQVPKCQDCPQFLSIMEAAKQRVRELADWSFEELQGVLQQPPQPK
jgi:PHP family Zn ribbon phosphoesterase